jgi:glycosyltransferase involved in cell wall biosynthesis
MRLLFMSPDARAAGGAERHTTRLMLGLRERGDDVMLLTLAHEGEHAEELRAHGVPVWCARMRGRGDIAGWQRASKAARAASPDIVVSRSVSAHVVGQFLAWRAGAPHVLVDHGGAGLSLRPHQQVLMRGVARYADRAVAVSETQIPALRRLGVDPAAIRVIPNGISPEDSRPSRPAAETRAELGLDDGDFVALLVGSLRPEKRVPAFVRAVARASQEDTRIKGLVAGSGSELVRVEEEAARANGAVQLLGRREDVPALLAAADVVCLSSTTEALPLALLEAMAAGRAIVATRVGGIVDVVEDGTSGLLVPLGDEDAFASALVELARDRPRAGAMGAAGRRIVLERFTLDRMISSYQALFDELLAAA